MMTSDNLSLWPRVGSIGNMRSSHLILVVLVLCVSWASALSSTPFTKKNELTTYVNSFQPTTIKEAYYVVESQALLKTKLGGTQKEQFCTLANEALSAAKDVKSIFYAVFVSESLGCGKKVSDKVAATITKSMTKANLEDLFCATLAAFRLQEANHINIDDSELAKAIDILDQLSSADGTFRNTPKTYVGNFFHSGLAFRALALLSTLELDSNQETVIETLQENVSGVLELTRDVDFASTSNLRAVAELLKGSLSFVKNDDLDLEDKEQYFGDLLEFALNNVPSSGIQDVYYFLSILDTLTEKAKVTPVVLSLSQTSLSASSGKEGNINVKVSDLYGAPLKDAKVFLLKAASFADDSKVVMTNQQLRALQTPGEHEINFMLSKPDQGFYSLDFGVQLQDSSVMRKTSRTVKITSSVSVDSVSVKVIDSVDKDVVERHTIADGKTVNLKTSYFLTLEFAFTVKNKVTGKPTSVQQAFIRIHKGSLEGVYPATKHDNEYRLVLNLKVVGADVHFKTDDYQFELIIGDVHADNSFVRELGTLRITFPQSLEVQRENVYAAKPEINHIFRKPEKRPHESTSFAFTIAVLAPCVLLLAALPVARYSVPSGLGSISSLIFVGLIASYFGLYAIFWLGYHNMFQTLGWMGALSVATILVGNHALRSRALSRKKVA